MEWLRAHLMMIRQKKQENKIMKIWQLYATIALNFKSIYSSWLLIITLCTATLKLFTKLAMVDNMEFIIINSQSIFKNLMHKLSQKLSFTMSLYQQYPFHSQIKNYSPKKKQPKPIDSSDSSVLSQLCKSEIYVFMEWEKYSYITFQQL